MKKLVLALLGLVLVAGCASMARSMTYGSRLADARYSAGGKTFSVWVHPREETIMLQGTWGNALAVGAIEGITFGAGSMNPAYTTWLAGAEFIASPADCEVRNLRPIDQAIMWEFDYACPEGVDLRALIMAQRESLRAGNPLQVAPLASSQSPGPETSPSPGAQSKTPARAKSGSRMAKRTRWRAGANSKA